MLGVRQGSLAHQGRANLVEQPPIDMHPLHQIRKLLPSLQDSLISSLSQQSSDHDDIDVLEGGDLFRRPDRDTFAACSTTFPRAVQAVAAHSR